jgi:long-chain acyl-CoA synthetase
MRDNSTILHRLYLWYLDQPNVEAQLYRDENQNWQPIRVKQYWLNVVRIARAIQNHGIKPGEKIAIYALNSPEWVQWELGTWLAGCVSISIHPNTGDLDLQRILDQAEPKLILAESDLFKEKVAVDREYYQNVMKFDEAARMLLDQVTNDEALLVAQGEELLKKIDPEATQIIIYTSGTMGIPKGVLLGLKQLTFVADSLNREWNLPFANGSLFSFLPLSHIAEKIQAIGVAISQRYPVWFNSKYERFLEELKEVRPIMLLAVPRVWERMKEQIENHKPKLLRRVMEFDRLGPWAEKIYLSQVKEHLGLDQLVLAVAGAAKLPPSVGQWFKGIGIEIQEIYGMSESTGMITLTNSPRKNFSGVGVPPLGVEVKLSQEGEVWVRGPHVFKGYDQDPEETRKVLLEDGWLKTGDLGEWVKSGTAQEELQIIGRNREIIKLSNGRMVAPLPIENALKEIAEVSNVCVVGEGYSQVLALITLKDKVLMEYKFVPGSIEGLVVEDEALKKRIAESINALTSQKKISERIHKFVILSREFSVDQGEMTATQKLNRNSIHKNFKYFIELNYDS